MKMGIADEVRSILSGYDPAAPQATARALRHLWLHFEPKSVEGIKAEQRVLQETVGIPVPVLKEFGREVGKVARKRVNDFIPLARLLWDEYGREGRIVAVVTLGPMELAAPSSVIPILMGLCRTCYTWEDADQLAMSALEPIIRKEPELWLPALESWLSDENKWVRRAGVTVVGRLPMKHPGYSARCLELIERMLHDQEDDVKKAVSFAIRVVARGDVHLVREFLARQVPPENPDATWVLCDSIRSMTKKFLPELVSLLPLYRQWAAAPDLGTKDRRSVESAMKTLQKAL